MAIGVPYSNGPRTQLKDVGANIFTFQKLQILPDQKLTSKITKQVRQIRQLLDDQKPSDSETLPEVAEDTQEEIPQEIPEARLNQELVFEYFDADIAFALGSDFTHSPRYDCQGMVQIPLHNRKQANKDERMIALFTALRWGSKDISKSTYQHFKIGDATCKQTASYDCGFHTPFSSKQLSTWF